MGRLTVFFSSEIGYEDKVKADNLRDCCRTNFGEIRKDFDEVIVVSFDKNVFSLWQDFFLNFKAVGGKTSTCRDLNMFIDIMEWLDPVSNILVICQKKEELGYSETVINFLAQAWKYKDKFSEGIQIYSDIYDEEFKELRFPLQKDTKAGIELINLIDYKQKSILLRHLRAFEYRITVFLTSSLSWENSWKGHDIINNGENLYDTLLKRNLNFFESFDVIISDNEV